MNSGFRLFAVPIFLLLTFTLLFYLALDQFSQDLARTSAIEQKQLQLKADTELNKILNKKLGAIEIFSASAAIEDLVINNHLSEITNSLESWRKSFNLPVLAFFDVESNTLYLSDAPSRAGETYGLSDWITEQLSGPAADRSARLLTFRGKPTWMKSANVQIAGEIKALIVSGITLDKSLVNELSNTLLYPVVLTHSNGGRIISATENETLPPYHLSINLPTELEKSGYKLLMYYDAMSPYQQLKKWQGYALLITLFFILGSILWVAIQYPRQLKQWRFIGSLADSPESLQALPLKGAEKTVANSIASEVEKLRFKNETLQNQLSKIEHSNQSFRRNIKQIRGEKNRLQHAPKVKSGFLSRMGDEITSPMKSVSSMLKLLVESKLPDEPAEVVEIATRSHQMMSSNIENVLDFSKLDAGLLKLFMADFDIEVLIRELVKELEPHADSKELSMEWHIHDRVPESCYGDRQRIHQILYNLAGNAIRFTKEGTIGVYVDMIYEKGRQFIRYTVTDTGIGIPKPAQEAVFESLDPHSKLTTSSFAGRLRLIVSKQLTELMGGEMGLSSEVGKGSRFWFTIRYQNPRGL